MGENVVGFVLATGDPALLPEMGKLVLKGPAGSQVEDVLSRQRVVQERVVHVWKQPVCDMETSHIVLLWHVTHLLSHETLKEETGKCTYLTVDYFSCAARLLPEPCSSLRSGTFPVWRLWDIKCSPSSAYWLTMLLSPGAWTAVFDWMYSLAFKKTNFLQIIGTAKYPHMNTILHI